MHIKLKYLLMSKGRFTMRLDAFLWLTQVRYFDIIGENLYPFTLAYVQVDTPSWWWPWDGHRYPWCYWIVSMGNGYYFTNFKLCIKHGIKIVYASFSIKLLSILFINEFFWFQNFLWMLKPFVKIANFCCAVLYKFI